MVMFLNAYDRLDVFISITFLLNRFKLYLIKWAPVTPSIKNPIPSDKIAATNQNMCVVIIHCTIVIHRYAIGFL